MVLGCAVEWKKRKVVNTMGWIRTITIVVNEANVVVDKTTALLLRQTVILVKKTDYHLGDTAHGLFHPHRDGDHLTRHDIRQPAKSRRPSQRHLYTRLSPNLTLILHVLLRRPPFPHRVIFQKA